jgi:hypothetical protein
MAKKDNTLFDRLQQAGLRKQVAKALSEIGEGAGKKAERTARAAVKELRAIADEIERRLPSPTPPPPAARKTARTASTPKRAAATPRATRSRATGTGAKPKSSAAAKPKPATRRATTTRASTGRRTTGTPRRASAGSDDASKPS